MSITRRDLLKRAAIAPVVIAVAPSVVGQTLAAPAVQAVPALYGGAVGGGMTSSFAEELWPSINAHWKVEYERWQDIFETE